MSGRGRKGYGAPPEPGCGAPFVPDADGFDANAGDGYGPPPAPQAPPKGWPKGTEAWADPQARPDAPRTAHPLEGARDSYGPPSAPVGLDWGPPPGVPRSLGLPAVVVVLALVLVPFASCAGCSCAVLGAAAMGHEHKADKAEHPASSATQCR